MGRSPFSSVLILAIGMSWLGSFCLLKSLRESGQPASPKSSAVLAPCRVSLTLPCAPSGWMHLRVVVCGRGGQSTESMTVLLSKIQRFCCMATAANPRLTRVQR